MNINFIKQFSFCRLCIAITFVSSCFTLAFVQGILSISLWRFSKRAYRKINYYINYSIFAQLVFLSEWWAGNELTIYVDKDDYEKYFGKEHAYWIMNHSYEIDWLIKWHFCENIQVLGNCKAYVKKSIQYIPPVGWFMKLAEFVFLARSFDNDKIIIEKQISSLCDYPDPVALLCNPEGTRFSTEKHEASQKFAKEKGFPVLKHHLIPRTRGFTTSIPAMRGKINAVYDTVIAFSKGDKAPPTLTSLLFGKKLQPHLYINRIPIENIPQDEEGCAKWLIELFETKDKMMESFHKTGDFFAESNVKRIVPFKSSRRPFTLISSIIMHVIVFAPIVNWLQSQLFNGKLFSSSIILLGGIILFHFALKCLVGITEIKKSSSYGVEKKKC